LNKKNHNIISDIEENLRFFSQIGAEFIFKKDLDLTLDERILQCRKCPLAQTRKHAVPGEGDLNADLMFVGEAPGRDEDLLGRPFVGRAGKLLTKIIEAMKFKRDEVYITNIIKCRPPENRNPQPNEIQECQGYLFEQIERIKPRMIVALGKVAASFFIADNLSMTKLRGRLYDFQGISVMPTFHPSYLVRNEQNKLLRKLVWEDMKEVMSFLDKK